MTLNEQAVFVWICNNDPRDIAPMMEGLRERFGFRGINDPDTFSDRRFYSTGRYDSGSNLDQWILNKVIPSPVKILFFCDNNIDGRDYEGERFIASLVLQFSRKKPKCHHWVFLVTTEVSPNWTPLHEVGEGWSTDSLENEDRWNVEVLNAVEAAISGKEYSAPPHRRSDILTTLIHGLHNLPVRLDAETLGEFKPEGRLLARQRELCAEIWKANFAPHDGEVVIMAQVARILEKERQKQESSPDVPDIFKKLETGLKMSLRKAQEAWTTLAEETEDLVKPSRWATREAYERLKAHIEEVAGVINETISSLRKARDDIERSGRP